MNNKENNNRIPELRFPGFTGEWVEKKLGEVFEKHNEKNDLSFGVDKIISVANMYYKQDANVGNDDYLRTYNIFRLGDIAYEGNKSSNFAYGRFVENTIGDGIVSHVFDVYRPIISDYCIDYWKYAINYEQIMRPILEKATIKSTMMNNLIAKDFLKQSILLPPTLAEQQKIAECLSSLDEEIAAEAQKADALKDHKCGLMQQLFPAMSNEQLAMSNEQLAMSNCVPKLRFPGFEGEWVVKKLGEVCHINRGVRITRNDLNNNWPYPVFQNTDSPLGFYDKFNVKANNPFVIIGGSAGLVGFSKTNFWAADDCAYFGDCDNVNNYFLYMTLLFHSLEIKNFIRGGNIPRIDRKSLEQLRVSIPPTLAEQQKIADCLSELDEMISAQQQKVGALKEHKKGLMQKLFPKISNEQLAMSN